MTQKLAGTTFVYRGLSLDYCFIETIKCLAECTDKVFIMAGGDDGTYETIVDTKFDGHIFVRRILQDEWDAQKGREKLAYFQNLSIRQAQREGYGWNFLLQADEILHEECYGVLRQATEKDNEAYYAKRINLWGSPYTALNVPESRSPVGTRIIRVGRSFYPSVDDGESLLAVASEEFMHNLRIYHMGFVREKHKHLVKIKHIQEDVFGFEKADSRIDNMTGGFSPWVMFDKSDVSPIEEPLPKIITSWAKERANQ